MKMNNENLNDVIKLFETFTKEMGVMNEPLSIRCEIKNSKYDLLFKISPRRESEGTT